MSDQRDKKDDPAEELKQGLSHLWKAARGVATEVQKEARRTDFGKALDDAGREFVRAAANVVDRLSEEVTDLTRPRKPGDQRSEPPPGGGSTPPHDAAPTEPARGSTGGSTGDDDEFDGVKPKPRESGSPPQEPGFRIAVDDDEKKKGA
jgi:hypothetical protein